MSRLRLAIASAIVRSATVILRLTGSGGTSAPGKLLLLLAPRAISQRSAQLNRGCAVISATNGKTTTSGIVAEIMTADGATLVHNKAGANMAGGVAATLNDQHGDFGLFEVDEFWLPGLVDQLKPRSLLLANLFRDQLDRYGELDQIVDRWRDVIASPNSGQVVLNADDPLVAGLGSSTEAPLYFGIEDTAVGEATPQHASEQACCPSCGAQFTYSRYFVGQLGHYRCPDGHVSRPSPVVSATKISLDGLKGSTFSLNFGDQSFEVGLPLPGLYNVYNALAAAALAESLGVDRGTIVGGINSSKPSFGRAETLSVAGRACSIMLIKNPAGANEVIRTLASDTEPHDVLVVLNDQIADGRDISWIWDADFEGLSDLAGTVTCAGNRAAELALRLKYAGVAGSQITVEESLSEALSIAIGRSSDRLVILPTYTALLEVRELLVARSVIRDSFA